MTLITGVVFVRTATRRDVVARRPHRTRLFLTRVKNASPQKHLPLFSMKLATQGVSIVTPGSETSLQTFLTCVKIVALQKNERACVAAPLHTSGSTANQLIPRIVSRSNAAHARRVRDATSGSRQSPPTRLSRSLLEINSSAFTGTSIQSILFNYTSRNSQCVLIPLTFVTTLCPAS